MYPITVTVIKPEIALPGMSATMLVAVLLVTVIKAPLIQTVLFAVTGSKLAPVIVTVVPGGPDPGEKLLIVGGKTNVKLEPLVAVRPSTVTVMGPVVAPEGTVTVILVELLAVTVATVPLNCTTLIACTGLKLVPVIVIDSPVVPRVGVKLVMVGAGTAKITGLKVVIEPT